MKDNEEIGGNNGQMKQGVFPAEMATSSGLLPVLGLAKAEQDLALALALVGQRSCLMSQPPTAPTLLNQGKPQHLTSGAGHSSTPSADAGSSSLLQHKEDLQQGWEPAASSCSHKAPGNSTAQGAAGLLPRRATAALVRALFRPTVPSTQEPRR